jgi:hypothetical protein
VNLAIPQLVALASGAGFTGQDMVTAVAIALAESGGNPQAYNPERAAGTAQGAGSFGLWQIYLQAHPEFAGANLFDPQTNASAAYSVYSGAGGFSPWSTFKSGAYLAYADTVQQSIAPDVSGVVAADASAASSTPSIFALVTIGAVVFYAVIKIFG